MAAPPPLLAADSECGPPAATAPSATRHVPAASVWPKNSPPAPPSSATVTVVPGVSEP